MRQLSRMRVDYDHVIGPRLATHVYIVLSIGFRMPVTIHRGAR